MDRPIKFLFGEPEPNPVNVTGHRPENAEYTLGYAEAELYTIPEGTVLSQFYSNFLIFLELIQFDVTDELSGMFEVQYPAMFLFFDLNGHIQFSDQDDQLIYEATKGTYYATHNTAGTYKFKVPKGSHLVLCITPRLEWFRKGIDDYPKFRDFVNNIESGRGDYSHLQRCIIDDTVLKTLRQLFALSAKSTKGLRSKVVTLTIRLFDLYHEALDFTTHLKGKTPQEKALEIRAYLDSNYTDPYIDNLTQLANRFEIPEWTLVRIFSKVVKSTVHAYIDELRMAFGWKLLQESSLTIKEISHKIGYHYPPYFTRVFKKYFGKTPQEIRKSS
ncbi:AraC-type DNA-binding protein [Pedobacter westerhofensis]|uniref:AraC-type DNA-binding protein n=1 Tax=Pedobacter westerhofensis TaxID=425512 RepID=A0A521DR83_9SPHI|nr:AraC family transcriptional regulator [Pedobacter westerhofensis]SMO73621.1 AraC-type DNA-binding protein [Pedobacter westerhofensis]